MDNQKTTIGVFFGSRSCEHDVSVITAIQLLKSINREKYNVIPVYISQKGVWYTGDKLLDIRTYTPFEEYNKALKTVQLDPVPGSGLLIHYDRTKNGLFHKGITEEIIARIECAVPVFHGLHGEDGTIQGLFELADIPYTSTGICGSSVGMDKIAMKAFFAGCGFPVLPGASLNRAEWDRDREACMDRIITETGLPVFVKPSCLGSSIGISCAKDRAGLSESLDTAFSFDRRVLIETALDKPAEVNCSVLGYEEDIRASVLEMPNIGSADFLDYNEKYIVGSKGMAGLRRKIPAPISAELTAEIQELSKKVFKALDCKGVVRIDYMLDRHSDRYYITEINTIPGSMAYYLWEASGLRYRDLIDKMIEFAMRAKEEKKRNSFAFESAILSSFKSAGTKSGKLKT